MTWSEWYRAGGATLRAWLAYPPPQLTRRLRSKLISASAYCRSAYIDALVAEYGLEDASRILEQEAKPKLLNR